MTLGTMLYRHFVDAVWVAVVSLAYVGQLTKQQGSRFSVNKPISVHYRSPRAVDQTTTWPELAPEALLTCTYKRGLRSRTSDIT
jgi:hypothetical protein